mmetsp:Transcript_29904/g.33374  ORF Transcript_29904/g.33374 Transcript_29904/m.33374 type:complete len:416 (+) Transcript_29904:132-1379(+)
MSTQLSQRLRDLHSRRKKKRGPTAKASKKSLTIAATPPTPKLTHDARVLEKLGLSKTEELLFESEVTQRGGLIKQHGVLYITKRHIGFESRVFGMTNKEVFRIKKLTDSVFENKKFTIKLHTAKKKYGFVFDEEKEYTECTTLLTSLKDSTADEEEDHTSTNGSMNSNNSRKSYFNLNSPETDGINTEPKLTRADWNLILGGAKVKSFARDTPIIKEGATQTNLYQIARGSCRIEKKREGVLGEMAQGQLFGEMSFIKGGGHASASVISNSRKTVLYIIESDYMTTLFLTKPDMKGRFYHYLASVLAERLNVRESDKMGITRSSSQSSSGSKDTKARKRRPVKKSQSKESMESSSGNRSRQSSNASSNAKKPKNGHGDVVRSASSSSKGSKQPVDTAPRRFSNLTKLIEKFDQPA